MAYIEVMIKADAAQLPFLESVCNEKNCLGIEELYDGFKAYFNESENQEVKEWLAQLHQEFQFESEILSLEDKNWNAEWESGYKPMFVGDFCAIYAPFHEKQTGFKHQLTINPEMAFGTGHHETTQMMLEQMQTIDFSGKTVLDLGSGTGILAIVASKEGAPEVTAVDIDEKAYKIMKENFVVNHTNHVCAVLGTIAQVEEKYDVILANINRNILLQDSQLISQQLNDGGRLIISGFYQHDADLLSSKFATFSLSEETRIEKNNWCSIIFRKD